MSHSIISYLGSLNNKYSDSYISILFNQKSTPGYMTIFASLCDKQHLLTETGSRQSEGNLPHVSHTKSIFDLVMNRTESKLQSPHFMPGLGQPFSKYYLNS